MNHLLIFVVGRSFLSFARTGHCCLCSLILTCVVCYAYTRATSTQTEAHNHHRHRWPLRLESSRHQSRIGGASGCLAPLIAIDLIVFVGFVLGHEIRQQLHELNLTRTMCAPMTSPRPNGLADVAMCGDISAWAISSSLFTPQRSDEKSRKSTSTHLIDFIVFSFVPSFIPSALQPPSSVCCVFVVVRTRTRACVCV